MKSNLTRIGFALALLSLLATNEAASAFYDPAAQRWLNRDLIGELGGINLYGYAANDPATTVGASALVAPAPVPLPAPPLTIPAPVIEVPPVILGTIVFVGFYATTDFVCEKTGVHGWLALRHLGLPPMVPRPCSS